MGSTNAMRANQSFTASGMYSNTGTRTGESPLQVGTGVVSAGAQLDCGSKIKPVATPRASLEIAETDGLLHDARNLFAAIGLYCELLSQGGLSAAEQAGYAGELQMIADRSRVMMERWARLAQTSRIAAPLQTEGPKPVAVLRTVAERCSGVLKQVSGGRAIEWSFGTLAAVPVWASEESIERVLVNLVRNAASALDAGLGQNGAAECIRIEVGGLDISGEGTGESRCLSVSLTVEDNGCGMGPEQIARLLEGGGSRADGHGLGFQIIRELAQRCGGDVGICSKPGVGTRVRVDWVVADEVEDTAPRQYSGAMIGEAAAFGYEGVRAC